MYTTTPPTPTTPFLPQLDRSQLATDLTDLQRRCDALEHANATMASRDVATTAALQSETQRRQAATVALDKMQAECARLQEALNMAQAAKEHMEQRYGPERQRRLALESALREVCWWWSWWSLCVGGRVCVCVCVVFVCWEMLFCCARGMRFCGGETKGTGGVKPRVKAGHWLLSPLYVYPHTYPHTYPHLYAHLSLPVPMSSQAEQSRRAANRSWRLAEQQVHDLMGLVRAAQAGRLDALEALGRERSARLTAQQVCVWFLAFSSCCFFLPPLFVPHFFSPIVCPPLFLHHFFSPISSPPFPPCFPFFSPDFVLFFLMYSNETYTYLPLSLLPLPSPIPPPS